MMAKRVKRTFPNSEAGYVDQLKHLAVESCKQLESSPSFFDQIDPEFMRQIYFMTLYKGARFELKDVESKRFTLEISGIRVELGEHEKDVKGFVDPASIAVIDITDCGYKICATVRIGHVEFHPAWDGGRITEIVSEEGQEMMRSLIEYAKLLTKHHIRLEEAVLIRNGLLTEDELMSEQELLAG